MGFGLLSHSMTLVIGLPCLFAFALLAFVACRRALKPRYAVAMVWAHRKPACMHVGTEREIRQQLGDQASFIEGSYPTLNEALERARFFGHPIVQS